MTIDKIDIQNALLSISEGDFAEVAKDLLGVLGYRSERVPPGQSGNVEDFIKTYPAKNPDTKSENFLRCNANSVRIMFQLTDSELGTIADQPSMLNAKGFEASDAKSFVFTSVEMGGGGRKFVPSRNVRIFSSGDKQEVFDAHCSVV